MDFKRITILCGHYGSGKTNVAVNLAFKIREKCDNVMALDLDIVNPYFRTKDSREDFEKAGIRLVASSYANTNVDIPALPGEMYAVTDDKRITAVLDVGGDDRGALALGRLAPSINAENNYDMLMVINCYRPLTKTVDQILEVMQEIETASNMKFTGLVNNSNLGALTTPEDILASLHYAEEASKQTGLPLVLTSVREDLCRDLEGKIENIFPLKLQKTLLI